MARIVQQRHKKRNNWRLAFIILLKCTAVLRKAKLTIYGTVLRSIVMCGLEAWTPSKSDESTLAICERKILRKILGPVKEIVVWRTRTNQDMMDLSREPGIMSEVRRREIAMIRTCGKNAKGRTVKKMFKNIPDGKGSPFEGQRRRGWTMLKMVRRKKMSRGLTKLSGDRDAWKLVLKGATNLHGPQCQWRERERERERETLTLIFLYTNK